MKKPTDRRASIKKVASRRFTTAADDNILETYIIIPPDGGWGWVIVFVAFMSNFVADGTMYSFGMFIEDISKTIGGTTPEAVAITNSVMTGCYYLFAPIVSALTNRCGYRLVAMTGGFMAASAHLFMSHYVTLITTYTVYGIIGGIGFGMMYVPTLIAVSYYFEKWRALTASLVATGSAVGIILFPIIFKVILKDQTWQENFRVISIFVFCAGCLCVLYRELEPVRIVSTDDTKIRFQDDPTTLKASVSKYHNVAFPTSANAYGKQNVAVVSAPSSHRLTHGALGRKSDARLEVASYKGKRIDTVYEDDDDDDDDDDDYYYYQRGNKCQRFINKCKKRACCKCCRRFCKSCPLASCCCCCCFCCQQKHDISAPIRPMYRDDIFYEGSLMHLPAYAKSVHHLGAGGSQPQDQFDIDYYLSVTRVTTIKDIMETDRCVCCPEAVKRTLATMMDLSLLKSPSFLLLSFSGFFSMFGMFTPIMFLVERAKSYGIPEETAFSLITVLGIANAVGRISGGLLSSLPNLNALAVSSVSITICGIATLLSSVSKTIQGQYAFAAVFASTIACLAGLRSIIIVDMVGLEKLTNACGLSLLFQGFACLGGVPTSAYLKSATGTYDAAFYFSGSSILLSGIMLMLVHPLFKYEKRRKNLN